MVRRIRFLEHEREKEKDFRSFDDGGEGGGGRARKFFNRSFLQYLRLLFVVVVVFFFLRAARNRRAVIGVPTFAVSLHVCAARGSISRRISHGSDGELSTKNCVSAENCAPATIASRAHA